MFGRQLVRTWRQQHDLPQTGDLAGRYTTVIAFNSGKDYILRQVPAPAYSTGIPV